MSRSVCTNRSSMFLISLENRPMAVTFLTFDVSGAAGSRPPDTLWQRHDTGTCSGSASDKIGSEFQPKRRSKWNQQRVMFVCFANAGGVDWCVMAPRVESPRNFY